MKTRSILLVSIISLSAVADSMSFARKLVVQEIQEYQADYGVTDLLHIEDRGIVNKKYSFNVSYSKQFCWDSGDDERMTCANFQCTSVANVDSDAVVDFETEPSRKNCQEIPDTRTTEQY